VVDDEGQPPAATAAIHLSGRTWGLQRWRLVRCQCCQGHAESQQENEFIHVSQSRAQSRPLPNNLQRSSPLLLHQRFPFSLVVMVMVEKTLEQTRSDPAAPRSHCSVHAFPNSSPLSLQLASGPGPSTSLPPLSSSYPLLPTLLFLLLLLLLLLLPAALYRPVARMEKTLCSPHLGTPKASSPSSDHRGSSSSSRKAGARSGSHSPGSVSAGAGHGRGGVQGNSPGAPQQPARRRQLEGVLSKYTNLIQGWQNRYFVLDPELGQLQYFVNEQGKSQKPRGSLPLIGASVSTSDEAPHMFVVNSVNGELYKLRAADAKEQQFWISQLQACARRHSDSSAKVRKLKGSDEHLSVERAGGGQEMLGSSSSGRTRSFSLLPHLTPSSSPSSQRHPGHTAAPSNIVTITHHKSPAAARRAKSQYPGRLLEVKEQEHRWALAERQQSWIVGVGLFRDTSLVLLAPEREVMSQAEGQQKNLVQSIDSLPTKGPLSCLDQDLLLLKATSAATLSCLGECLNILQQTQSHSQAPPQSQASQRYHTGHGASSGESVLGPVPVLLLEPPTPPTPTCPLSFQSPPPEPTGKAQLVQLDCGSCPCLMGPVNFRGGVEWDHGAASTNLFPSAALLMSPVGAQLLLASGMYPPHLNGAPVWTVPKSPSGEQLKNGGLTPLRSAEPSPALRKRSLSHGAEVRNTPSHRSVWFTTPHI
ncbi:unnamed protein product, partial [Menidia menidia]